MRRRGAQQFRRNAKAIKQEIDRLEKKKENEKRDADKRNKGASKAKTAKPKVAKPSDRPRSRSDTKR